MEGQKQGDLLGGCCHNLGDKVVPLIRVTAVEVVKRPSSFGSIFKVDIKI